jgi:hypothetical protein
VLQHTSAVLRHVTIKAVHGMPGSARGAPMVRTTVIPLWERYQQCLVTTDPTELVLIIEHSMIKRETRCKTET